MQNSLHLEAPSCEVTRYVVVKDRALQTKVVKPLCAKTQKLRVMQFPCQITRERYTKLLKGDSEIKNQPLNRIGQVSKEDFV